MQDISIIKKKINFYYKSKEACHIRKNGIGFINAHIQSDIIDDLFIFVTDLRYPDKPKRIFIDEIFDISDYISR